MVSLRHVTVSLKERSLFAPSTAALDPFQQPGWPAGPTNFRLFWVEHCLSEILGPITFFVVELGVTYT
jgi:hypothetical protein